LSVGPYWSFLELVTGMGLLFESHGQMRMKWAIYRRLLYPLVAGAAVAWIDSELGLGVALLVGCVAAFLLLWPVVFHGLPLGVARSDWLLIPIYLGFIVAFGAASALGRYLVEYARAQGGGSPIAYLRQEGPGWVITAIIGWRPRRSGAAEWLGSASDVRAGIARDTTTSRRVKTTTRDERIRRIARRDRLEPRNVARNLILWRFAKIVETRGFRRRRHQIEVLGLPDWQEIVILALSWQPR
jgi:hypothetical protein